MHRKTALTGFLLASILVITVLALAGETGQIKGTITAAETGNPVVGASIQIVGTTRGALTDFNGKYVIANLKPGSYTLKITHLDFQVAEIKSVSVVSDLPTTQNITLVKKVTSLDDKVVVVTSRDVIDKFEVSSQTIMSKEQIGVRPAHTVDELLAEVSGAVTSSSGDVFIRGGRAGEVQYITDGVEMGDPLGGLGQASASLSMRKNRADASKRWESSSFKPRPRPYPRRPDHEWDDYIARPYPDAMFFEDYGVNPFIDTRRDHLSTFAIDVDDASYTLTRCYLDRGTVPPKEAVRVEEFVNHFDYDYTPPSGGAFEIYSEGGLSLFADGSHLLKIGIKGRDIRKRDRKPANLIFVVDVSGSMQREDRLSLVKRSLKLMVEQLNSRDQVGIIAYNSTAWKVLKPTSVWNRHKITEAIDRLYAGGSTNADQGLRLGYEMADRCFDKERINRVILLSDGVANTGDTNPENLLRKIKSYADQGITLTTVGVGMGNYNDVLLEKLGDKGNGQYHYIDDMKEARRFFVENLTGNLQVIARDVKIQVDFDPSVVASYRLLGYENRAVADHQFRNDTVDGGEVGAGHQVTALYEIRFQDQRRAGYVAKVSVRFKDPDNIDEVTEISRKINTRKFYRHRGQGTVDFRLAACAAQFSEILRGSPWVRGSYIGEVIAEVEKLRRSKGNEQIDDLLKMLRQAQTYENQLAER